MMTAFRPAYLIQLSKDIFMDLLFGGRQLLRSPGFTIAAALTLALGVGINTALFSVADAVLLRPLPWPKADRMVMISERTPKSGLMNDSWPDYLDWKSQNNVFSKMTVLQPSVIRMNNKGIEQSLAGAYVTNSFFELFGAEPMIGRDFTDAESRPGAGFAAVVSYGFWQHYLGGDRSAIGRPIHLDGQTAMLVGVLPPQFRIPNGPFQIFLPFALKTNNPAIRDRANHPGLNVIAELSPGVTISAARTEMASIMQRLAQAYPTSNKNESVVIIPLLDRFVSQARTILFLLLGASGLILVLAVANLANMCLARAATRQREFSVRISLGASRWRLFRQALVENLPLTILGGAAGVGLAGLLIKPMIDLYPHRLFRLEESGLNLAAISFAAIIALASWPLFGLLPAFMASQRRNIYSITQRSKGAAVPSRGLQLRSVLLTAEIAIAFVVTVSTGLLLRSLQAAAHVDPGFRPQHLLVIENVFAGKRIPSPENLVFYRALLDRLRNLPGVENASAVMQPPLQGIVWTSPYVPDGHPEPANTQQPWTEINVAMPNYFQTMGMRLKAGKYFDDADAEPVALINEAMARSISQNSPIGRQIYVQYAPRPAMQIVGVVAGEKQFGLEQSEMPEVYIPATQFPAPVMDIVLRTATDPVSISKAVELVMVNFEKNQSPPRVVTMETLIDSDLGDLKFASVLFGLFDGLAVILAIVGVVGIVLYTVEQRRREIGVRMALGARKKDVIVMIVLQQGVTPAVFGILLGIISAAGLTRFLESELYGIKSSDPIAFGFAAIILICTTILASFISARGAAKIDPAVTLRYE
jgi:putative ABC transport system permease protein